MKQVSNTFDVYYKPEESWETQIQGDNQKKVGKPQYKVTSSHKTTVQRKQQRTGKMK